MLNSAGEQIDLFTQELEKADHIDPLAPTGNISAGIGQDAIIGSGSSVRDRTLSSAPTVGSDVGATETEQDKLLAQNQARMNLLNSSKVASDSPSISGRNTPTLTAKQKRQIPRPDVTASPPSLTGRSSSKTRSLT